MGQMGLQGQAPGSIGLHQHIVRDPRQGGDGEEGGRRAFPLGQVRPRTGTAGPSERRPGSPGHPLSTPDVAGREKCGWVVAHTYRARLRQLRGQPGTWPWFYRRCPPGRHSRPDPQQGAQFSPYTCPLSIFFSIPFSLPCVKKRPLRVYILFFVKKSIKRNF